MGMQEDLKNNQVHIFLSPIPGLSGLHKSLQMYPIKLTLFFFLTGEEGIWATSSSFLVVFRDQPYVVPGIQPTSALPAVQSL